MFSANQHVLWPGAVTKKAREVLFLAFSVKVRGWHTFSVLLRLAFTKNFFNRVSTAPIVRFCAAGARHADGTDPLAAIFNRYAAAEQQQVANGIQIDAVR